MPDDLPWFKRIHDEITSACDGSEALRRGVHALCPPPIEKEPTIEGFRVAEFFQLVDEYGREVMSKCEPGDLGEYKPERN